MESDLNFDSDRVMIERRGVGDEVLFILSKLFK